MRAVVAARQEPGAPPPRLIPVLRARVVGGRRAARCSSRTTRTCAGGARWRANTPSRIARRSRATSASSMARSGRDRDPAATGPADREPVTEVSIEESIRDRFRIKVGDTMRFDVLGPDHRRACHQRPARRMGATAAPAASCSCSAPGSSTRRRTAPSRSSAARPTRWRADGCRPSSSPWHPTCRSSTGARFSRPSRRSWTTSRWP